MPTTKTYSQNDADCNNLAAEHLADGTAIVRVDGAALHFTSTSDTPRVRDLDLAAWFGYERPRDIRKLLKRMEREGKLAGISWRATVARQLVGPGGKGTREIKVTEAWLTREQSLLVATQAEGDRAWALTAVMAQVFDAALERRQAPADPATVLAVRMVQQLEARLDEQAGGFAALTQEVVALRAELATGVIGDAVARAEIVRPLVNIALLLATPNRGRRSVRRFYENKLRNYLGHTGVGSRWSMLPRGLLGVAQRQLAVWLDEAVAARAANGTSRQLTLVA